MSGEAKTIRGHRLCFESFNYEPDVSTKSSNESGDLFKFNTNFSQSLNHHLEYYTNHQFELK